MFLTLYFPAEWEYYNNTLVIIFIEQLCPALWWAHKQIKGKVPLLKEFTVLRGLLTHDTHLINNIGQLSSVTCSIEEKEEEPGVIIFGSGENKSQIMSAFA